MPLIYQLVEATTVDELRKKVNVMMDVSRASPLGGVVSSGSNLVQAVMLDASPKDWIAARDSGWTKI